MLNLQGLGVALITPFDKQGQVDYKALDKLIDFQMKNGIDYFVIMGTTAETPTLTEAERSTILTFVTNKVNNRIPIVVGFSGNNTAMLCQTIRNARQHKMDALLVACPYYNKPSQEGLFLHFKAVSEATNKPIVLYNIPGRTGVNLLPQTVIRIAKECKNVIAIKEASGNVEQIKLLIELIKANNLDFQVISGDDALTVQLMQDGACGVISVAANAFPKDFATLVHQADKAQEIQNKYAKMIELLFADGNPSGIKCVLSEQKKISNQLRLPLVPVTQITQELIKREFKKL